MAPTYTMAGSKGPNSYSQHSTYQVSSFKKKKFRTVKNSLKRCITNGWSETEGEYGAGIVEIVEV